MLVGDMNGNQISYYTLLISCFLGYVDSENCDNTEDDHRLKRQVNGIPLIYPYGGTYKLLIGFSTPVKLKDGMSLLFAVNFQYQYVQFTNISQLSQYYYVKDVSRGREMKDVSRERARGMRDVDLLNRKDERITFYKSFAGLLDSRGMNGQECVLRAICEAAQYPVENEGLVGEIMHILLTPDYGHTPFDDEDEDYQESIGPYRDAAIVGRQMFSCPSVFKGCPEGQGVLELISLLRDE